MTALQTLGVLLVVAQITLVAWGFTDDSKVAERSIVASYVIGLLVSFIAGIALILGVGQ